MNTYKLINPLLSIIFKGLLSWSAYCLLVLFLDFFVTLNNLPVLSNLYYILPNIIESLMVAIFVVSYYVLRLLKEK